MTTTNDLLDRMAAAARECHVIGYADECLGEESNAICDRLDAVLAEYDRLRASPSQEKAGERQRAIAVLCAFTGRCVADLAEEEIDIMRNALDAVLHRTHPTPEADAPCAHESK